MRVIRSTVAAAAGVRHHGIIDPWGESLYYVWKRPRPGQPCLEGAHPGGQEGRRHRQKAIRPTHQSRIRRPRRSHRAARDSGQQAVIGMNTYRLADGPTRRALRSFLARQSLSQQVTPGGRLRAPSATPPGWYRCGTHRWHERAGRPATARRRQPAGPRRFDSAPRPPSADLSDALERRSTAGAGGKPSVRLRLMAPGRWPERVIGRSSACRRLREGGRPRIVAADDGSSAAARGVIVTAFADALST